MLTYIAKATKRIRPGFIAQGRIAMAGYARVVDVHLDSGVVLHRLSMRQSWPVTSHCEPWPQPSSVLGS